MAKRITDEQIEQINKVYLDCGTYSGTAKIVGVSPSSVKKYIIPDYSEEPIIISKVNKISPKDINSINKFKSAIDVYNATLVGFIKKKLLAEFILEQLTTLLLPSPLIKTAFISLVFFLLST